MGIPVSVQPPVPPAIIAPAEAYAAGRSVSFGLPVSRNVLDDAHIRVRSGASAADAQTRVLARWPDGDPKWILVSFPAFNEGAAPARGRLELAPGPAPAAPPVATQSERAIEVLAADARFTVLVQPGFGLVETVVASDGVSLSLADGPALDVVAVDASGDTYRARRDAVWLQENGPHRAVIAMHGRLVGPGRPLLRFTAELEFDAKRPGPIVRLTLRNDDGDTRRNVRFRSLVLRARLAVGAEEGFRVACPQPDPSGDCAFGQETRVLQGLSGLTVRGADASRFHGPENLGVGYSISSPSAERSFPASSYPPAHWVLAGNGRHEALASIRHLAAYWGGFHARPNGEIDLSLFAPEHGPHTMRFGSWETREARVLAGPAGSIRASAEAFAFEYPRLARLQDPSVWNRSRAYPSPLSSVEDRESALASIDGATPRDLRTCLETPYRVRYFKAGTAGGANQWDAALDYWFAWASTGDPSAWLIAEAWADYRTDRAVPHAGTSDPVNENEFPVTVPEEVFDSAHRHSGYLPIWFYATGQIRFDIAAHDEFSSLCGNSRISRRYFESRITSRLIDLGAVFSTFAVERGNSDAAILYPWIRDYLGAMLSARWEFDDPHGSAGWANDANRRDRDPRTFWAASPGKGDKLRDVSFMVVSLVPRALTSWIDRAPGDDLWRPTAQRRLVDLADFSWDYLVSKSEEPRYRGIFFDFDTRHGAPPAPNYGEPGYDPNDLPELYHPLYDVFTSAYRVTGDAAYLDHAAYWAAGQTSRNAPWVTFHRPDFQRFAHEWLRAER